MHSDNRLYNPYKDRKREFVPNLGSLKTTYIAWATLFGKADLDSKTIYLKSRQI